MRILIVNNIPAPYFNPLFARLDQERDWSLRVCYTSSWNRDAGWVEQPVAETAYQTIILDRRHPLLTRCLGSSIAAGASLLLEFRKEQPDYVISYGYTLVPQFIAIVWSAMTRTKFAVVGDSNIYSDLSSGWRRRIKRLWLGRVIRWASALIAIGTSNRRFWERYGAGTEQLFEARYAVDNGHFAHAVETQTAATQQLRARLGLSGEPVFLFVGRLVSRKNVDLIVRAVKELPNEKLALLIVGDGEQREALEELAASDKRIVFLGTLQADELALCYAIAEVLVLPARNEPWGLVVNEAMAGGLAIIAHEHCGAAVDLVASDNGVTLSSFEVKELASAMQRLANDHELRRAMRNASRVKIKDSSIESAARGIIDAVTRSSLSSVGHTTQRAVEEVK